MSMLLSIDGNIGCGKSTLIDSLQKLKETNIIDEHFDRNIINKLVYFQETINIWNTIVDDNKTLLEQYYENQKKYGFCFQMMVILARITELKKIIKLNPDSIIVMERSFYSDKYIFLDMLYDKTIIDTYEYQIYNLWFESIVKDLPTHYYLYLTSTPERCIEKIQLRNRTGEQNIKLEYLDELHNYHEKFFNHSNDLIKNKWWKTLYNYSDISNNTPSYFQLLKNILFQINTIYIQNKNI
jgi:deoxyadenosine/deoxycytidine kinase